MTDEEGTQDAQPNAMTPRERFTLADVFVGPDGPRAGWCLIVYLAIVVVLYSGVGFLMQWLYPHGTAVDSRMMVPGPSFLGEGLVCLIVLGATWAMSKLERRPIAAYGLASCIRLRNFAAGFTWGLAALSLLVLALRASGLLAFGGVLLHGASALRYGAIWLTFFLVLGVFEESAFRGYLQFTLARGIAGIYRSLPGKGLSAAMRADALGFWSAALLLSFGFGFIHRTNQGESPVGLVAASLIAVIFCLSLWRTGSLWWAVGFHAAWDWAQSFCFGVADSGTLVEGRLLASHPVGKLLLSGGQTGPEGSLLILPILALVTIVVVLTLPQTRVNPRQP